MKAKKTKDNILKSSFFLKLFGIPSICISILAAYGMTLPLEPDEEPMTWPEFFSDLFITLIVWFIICFVITLIINEIKKSKPKTKIVKEIQYITKPEEKIIAKPETLTEEIKKEEKTKPQKKKKDKCLYTCESMTDAYEYSKMAKYFPKRMYWMLVRNSFFLNIIVSALIQIITRSLKITLVFFILYQIYLMIFYKVRLEKITAKIYKRRLDKGKENINYIIKYFEDYFIVESEKVSRTIKYSEISKCIENDTNFYLEYALANMIIIIQKNECEIELINFIRDKFNNLENHIGEDRGIIAAKKKHNSKFIKSFMLVLFIITLLTFEFAAFSFGFFSKANPQNGFNFIKNAWIFWCWLPIPLLSIILGVIFNTKGYKCTKNIIAGAIVGIMLLLFGSFCLFPTYAKDYSELNKYKYFIDAELPQNGELEIIKWDTTLDEEKTNYVEINAYYNKENTDRLNASIKESNNWILSNQIESNLTIFIPSTFYSGNDIYYSIYNKTLNNYNSIPDNSGNYEIYAMRYDFKEKKLEIHKYNYNYIVEKNK